MRRGWRVCALCRGPLPVGAGEAPSGSGSLTRIGVAIKVTSLAGRDTVAALDVGHDALVRIEEGLRHIGPSTEILDGEQAWRCAEGNLLAGHPGHHRPVAVVGKDLLSLRRVQEVHESLGFLVVL